jgi:PKD repeat protein
MPAINKNKGLSSKDSRNASALAIAFAALMLASSFAFVVSISLPNEANRPVHALTITGDTYSGSGDWAITNPTVYTNEIVTVDGNLNITGTGSLTLINTSLTISQTSAFQHSILINGLFMEVKSGSTVQSTNATVGKWNTVLRSNNGVACYLYMDNSTSHNILFDIVHPGGHINNSTLYASGIWNQFAFGYDIGSPVANTLILYNDTFRDTSTVGQAQLDLIMTGSQFKMNYCQFINITLVTGAPDYNSLIHVSYQNNITISHNTFDNLLYPAFCFRGNDANPIADLNFANNTFVGIGLTNTTTMYGGELWDVSLRAVIANNHFVIVRNGSVGILIKGTNWVLNDNKFDLIDASGIVNFGVATYGILLVEQGNVVVLHGTIFNKILGSTIDGSPSVGISSSLAGNYTVCHSIMRNITDSAGGITPVDPANDFGPDIGNVTLFANYMDNIRRLANGIYRYGGGGGTISWNNITHVDGNSTGIMMHDNKQPILVHNNSVTLPLYGGNYGPGWQISVGAYSVCASDSWNVTFRDNHAGGSTTEWPSYDISAEKLGGGWWENTQASIDVSEPTIVRTIGANVTFRHDDQALRIVKDGVAQNVRYYSNGTSWAFFNKTDLASHYFNLSTANVFVSPSVYVDLNMGSYTPNGLTIADWYANSTSGSSVNFTISGVVSNQKYALRVDNVPYRLAWATSGAVTFTYSAWSSHLFQVSLYNEGSGSSSLTADFTYAITGQTVQFTDGSDGTGIYRWYWDFGDGQFSTSQDPNHVYKAPGKYTVSLGVEDSNGNSDTVTKTIQIGESPSGFLGFNLSIGLAFGFALMVAGILIIAAVRRPSAAIAGVGAIFTGIVVIFSVL